MSRKIDIDKLLPHTPFRPTISQEQVESYGHVEKEFTFFVKLADPEELDNADEVIDQEQWQIPYCCNDNHIGSLRVRKETQLGPKRGPIRSVYWLTMKIKDKKGKGHPGVNYEHETEIDEFFFKEFKRNCPKGMVKTRYVFHDSEKGIKWEIDCFAETKAEFRNWCKVDLEVADMRYNTPMFPVLLEEAILKQNNQRSEEEEAFVQRLFEEKFLKYNNRVPDTPADKIGRGLTA